MQWFGTGVLVKTAIIDEVGHGGVPHEDGVPHENEACPVKIVCPTQEDEGVTREDGVLPVKQLLHEDEGGAL